MEQTTGSKNTDTTNLKAIVLVPILLFAMRAEEQSVAYIVWMQRHESVFQTFTSLSSPADANKAPLTLKQIALIASEWERPPQSSDNETGRPALEEQSQSKYLLAHSTKWDAEKMRSTSQWNMWIQDSAI